jgi:5-methylcytosine-specific restriction endonuclease McrA
LNGNQKPNGKTNPPFKLAQRRGSLSRGMGMKIDENQISQFRTLQDYSSCYWKMAFENARIILNCLRKSTTGQTRTRQDVLQSALSQLPESGFCFRQSPAILLTASVTVTSSENGRIAGFCIGDKMKKHVMAVYGNITLERGYCDNCKTMTIIKGGKYQCCDDLVENIPTKFERMSMSPDGRKTPTAAEKRKILNQQGTICFYCCVEFGSIRFRHGLPFFIKTEWDHQMPFAYSQNNSTENFVAACHVCNGIKSSHIFQTIEEARAYLTDKRKSKGYDF